MYIHAQSLADPPAPGQGNGALVNVFTTMMVKDTDKFVSGFCEFRSICTFSPGFLPLSTIALTVCLDSGEHAISRTGSWGYSVGMARSEICDETLTEVFAGFEGGDLNNGELTKSAFREHFANAMYMDSILVLQLLTICFGIL